LGTCGKGAAGEGEGRGQWGEGDGEVNGGKTLEKRWGRLTINDLFLLDRDSILIPFLPLRLPLPCPSPPRPTATTSRDHNAENKIADINNNVAIQQLLSSSSSPPHPMASLLPLLYCPLCPPHSTLTAPVTLFCGHTVCARHVSDCPSSSHVPVLLRLTPCPLTGCTTSPTTRTHFNIPSSSRVTFYPADGPLPDNDAFSTTPNTRTDITVNKLAMIIHRYVQQQQAQSTQRLPAVDTDSGSDSQTDEEILDTRDPSPQAFTAGSSANTGEPSSIPRQISSDGSQQGPARVSARKRRRKRLPPPRRLDAPAQSGDQFEKELLAELTCEICLTLFYQPITSPCQHVSVPIPL
jgi:hypothetical protein